MNTYTPKIYVIIGIVVFASIKTNGGSNDEIRI